MRFVAACVVTVVVAATPIAACHDDFQDLFTEPDARLDASSDARPGDGGPSSDAPYVPCTSPSPPPDPKTCPSAACDGSTCGYTCSGCGCACPPAKCPEAPTDASACVTSCGSGTSCAVTCDAVPACTASCDGCTGTYACKPRTARCDVTVDHGGSLTLTCESTDSCSLTCKSGSKCLLTCSDKALAPCDLHCDGTLVTCGPRSFACNRPCM